MAALTWSLGNQIPCQRNVWWPAKGEVEGRQRKPGQCLVRAFGWILAILEIDWWRSVLTLYSGSGWKREQSHNWHEPICWHVVPQSTNPGQKQPRADHWNEWDGGGGMLWWHHRSVAKLPRSFLLRKQPCRRCFLSIINTVGRICRMAACDQS